MIGLSRERLEELRDRLRLHGQRQSSLLTGIPTNPSKATQEAMELHEIVQEWGAFCEAMYMMMAVDKRVLNVEREVLRGALAILSDDVVRTRHMEAMIEAAAKRIAEEGVEKRFVKVIEELKHDPSRAEMIVILAAAVAAADDEVVDEEHALLDRMAKELGVDASRADAIVDEMQKGLRKKHVGSAKPPPGTS